MSFKITPNNPTTRPTRNSAHSAARHQAAILPQTPAKSKHSIENIKIERRIEIKIVGRTFKSDSVMDGACVRSRLFKLS